MEIEKEVTEFVKTINRGPLKEYFPKKKEDIDCRGIISGIFRCV